MKLMTQVKLRREGLLMIALLIMLGFMIYGMWSYLTRYSDDTIAIIKSGDYSEYLFPETSMYDSKDNPFDRDYMLAEIIEVKRGYVSYKLVKPNDPEFTWTFKGKPAVLSTSLAVFSFNYKAILKQETLARKAENEKH